MNKIRIIGASGSGKTTIGKIISKKTNIPLTSLDELRYDFSKTHKFENKRTTQQFHHLIQQTLNQKKWIIEGGYYAQTKKTCNEATLIIYLTTPLHQRLKNILKRYITRLLKGKNEGLKNLIHLITYNIQSKNKYKTRTKEFKKLYKNKTLFFKNATQAKKWIQKKL